MTLPMFLIVICISRVLAIFVTSFSVTLIPWNTWWGLLIWAAIFVAVIVLFLFLYKRIDDIQNWILKRLHRETRIAEKEKTETICVEVVDPDGNLIEKGVDLGKSRQKDGKRSEDKKEK